MRRSLTIIVVITLALVFCSTGCSWIRWQKVPDKEVSTEKIECKLFPPVFDTIVSAGSAIGAGVLVYNASGKCTTDDTSCDIGKFVSTIVGSVFLVSVVVWGIASATGWVNYNKCREYQERVSLDKQLNTSPELFKPVAPNPPL